jgi:hypothetical protein
MLLDVTPVRNHSPLTHGTAAGTGTSSGGGHAHGAGHGAHGHGHHSHHRSHHHHHHSHKRSSSHATATAGGADGGGSALLVDADALLPDTLDVEADAAGAGRDMDGSLADVSLTFSNMSFEGYGGPASSPGTDLRLEVVGQRVHIEVVDGNAGPLRGDAGAPKPAPVSWHPALGRSPPRGKAAAATAPAAATTQGSPVGGGGSGGCSSSANASAGMSPGIGSGSGSGKLNHRHSGARAVPPDPAFGRGGVLDDLILVGNDDVDPDL